MNIPRNDYPRPGFVRDNWINLNGQWQFETDNAKSGKERKLYNAESLSGEITVPFCPESKLSGIENTDFINCVWYKRKITLDPHGKRTLLHFGAVDYYASVYVNGRLAGTHKGGYTSFAFDISDYVVSGENTITVCAEDDVRGGRQPGGKQSDKLESYGCLYTRTTGIWQTVWIEYVSECYIQKLKLKPEISLPSINLSVVLSKIPTNAKLTAEAFWGGKSVGKETLDIISNNLCFDIRLSEKHLWEIGKGGLYDLKLTLESDSETYDSVDSYFGLRSVALDGKAFKLNGKTVFGRWVLDQGFYPDGIYTAPTDDALKADIEYSMQLGFNGARLHEKIFEERFLYWADKLGYMVWGEHANWSYDITATGSTDAYLQEWLEAVERDFNHPSIIGWCPFNETTIHQNDEIIRSVYRATKAVDSTRPVIDSSGWFHVETDIYDVHNYQQEPKAFASDYENLSEGNIIEWVNTVPETKGKQEYDGKLPMFVSEYGGIKWGSGEGWGYGDGPKTEEEFIKRYKGLTDVLLDNPNMMGFCYTQLYDVEQEQNGLMTYDRRFKFDPEEIKEINTKKAAIEALDERNV